MALSKKNKRIIIASESPELYTSKRLLFEAKKLRLKAEWFNPYQHIFSIQSDDFSLVKELGYYFHRTSGTRYDDFDLSVSSHHEHLGFKIINPIKTLTTFRNKDQQSLFFSTNQLPLINTICYRGLLTPLYLEQIIALSSNQKYIIKMNRGNQGIGVNLINGAQSLKSILETFHAIKDQKFIIQPFIEHQKEWRVFIIRQEIIGIIERTITPEDFRGNSKRSNGKWLKKIPAKIASEILRGTKLGQFDYCGVDLIVNGDEFTILEFNPVAGFSQLEELSGINIAKELLTRLL